jgi:hypothetical protein
VNVVPGWWWEITLLEARPPSEAGPIADGAVSIAVQSAYPGKQACLLLSDLLQEAENTAGKVVRQVLSSVGHERQWHHRYQGKE